MSLSKSVQKRLNIQRGLTMTIREEFEKAFQEEIRTGNLGSPSGLTFYSRNTALWAAKWMAERIQQEAHSRDKQLMEYEIEAMKRELND